jgi:hypothetical protein
MKTCRAALSSSTAGSAALSSAQARVASPRGDQHPQVPLAGAAQPDGEVAAGVGVVAAASAQQDAAELADGVAD